MEPERLLDWVPPIMLLLVALSISRGERQAHPDIYTHLLQYELNDIKMSVLNGYLQRR